MLGFNFTSSFTIDIVERVGDGTAPENTAANQVSTYDKSNHDVINSHQHPVISLTPTHSINHHGRTWWANSVENILQRKAARDRQVDDVIRGRNVNKRGGYDNANVLPKNPNELWPEKNDDRITSGRSPSVHYSGNDVIEMNWKRPPSEPETAAESVANHRNTMFSSNEVFQQQPRK